MPFGKTQMEFAANLQTLLDEGRLQLDGPDTPGDDDRKAGERVLAEFEQRFRLDLPADPPEFVLQPAMCAADSFFRACICLTHREIDAAGVDEILSVPFPAPTDASAHYSVDVVFRLLPDLYQRARAASRDDPLLVRLQHWAKSWPLSSVGISEVDPENLDAILQCGCLTRMYVDRIIVAKDTTRLSDPRVRDAVAAAIGMHVQLAPEISAALSPETENVTE